MAAAFFVAYLAVLGFWPALYWVRPNTVIGIWRMYDRVQGPEQAPQSVSVWDSAGVETVLPQDEKRPYCYLYRPGEGPLPGRLRGENAIVGFSRRVGFSRTTDTLDEIGPPICAAMADAEQVTLLRSDGELDRYPCPR